MLKLGNFAMSKTFNADGPRILLVEGDNDGHVILALRDYYQIPKESFGLSACGSDKEVIKRLNGLLNTERKETIGVVLDADNPNLAGKWQQFRATLEKKVGISLTDNELHKDGTIIPAVNDHPKIGLWLMPNNQLDGMLEDFCMSLAKSKMIDFAQNCVLEAQKQGHTSFKPNHHSKAVVHTYLAWQDEPGRPLGQAITAKVLNPNQPLAKTFADWLKRLFVDT
jgi:hypothetical protein